MICLSIIHHIATILICAHTHTLLFIYLWVLCINVLYLVITQTLQYMLKKEDKSTIMFGNKQLNGKEKKVIVLHKRSSTFLFLVL